MCRLISGLIGLGSLFRRSLPFLLYIISFLSGFSEEQGSLGRAGMNSRMSCVIIFLALCLMNVHSSSDEGSKGNDTVGQFKDIGKYFAEKPEEMKKYMNWSTMQQKKQANETTHEINKTTKPALKSLSREKLSTRPLSTPTILSEIPTKTLVTQKPNPPTSKTTKSVIDPISKPATKTPISKQKSPTSKTTTSKSVTESPSKPSTNTPTSKQKSPTSKIMPAKSETETTSKPNTKTRTTKQKSPTSKPATTKNVTEIPSNSSTKNATITKKQLPSTSEATKDGNAPPSHKTNQAESMTDQFAQRSHFAVVFMVILVVVVAVYFGYHNRNKIHKFIKRGFSTSKHVGPGYLKVKLEDDIDLPREANRQYIY